MSPELQPPTAAEAAAIAAHDRAVRLFRAAARAFARSATPEQRTRTRAQLRAAFHAVEEAAKRAPLILPLPSQLARTGR